MHREKKQKKLFALFKTQPTTPKVAPKHLEKQCLLIKKVLIVRYFLCG
jgi:hypothetical protein